MTMDVPGWIYAAREVDASLVKIGSTRNYAHYRLPGLRREYKTAVLLLAVTPVRRFLFRVEHRVHTLLTNGVSLRSCI